MLNELMNFAFGGRPQPLDWEAKRLADNQMIVNMDIDDDAIRLFEAEGGIAEDWPFMDECARLHYRLEAASSRKPEPQPKQNCIP